MQKQIENDGDEHVDTQYIGNKNITMALKNLKAELVTRVRSDATHMISGGEGIEETVEAIGQLISEALLLGFKSPKKQTKFFEGFLIKVLSSKNLVCFLGDLKGGTFSSPCFYVFLEAK